MGKKRKSVATSLEEVDRTMYSTFCSAANSLSQLYSQAITQQKLTFHAGERHGLEKIYQWILRQQEEGSRVNVMDIMNYLQAELDYSGDEPSMSPRAPSLNQLSAQLANSGFLVSDSSVVAPNTSALSNDMTSPVRRGLQNYHISQVGQATNGVLLLPPSGNDGIRHNHQHNSLQHQERDSFYDFSMDMNADCPGPNSTSPPDGS